MLILLAVLFLGTSRPTANFNFVKVYGKIVGKKLTICESEDSLRVEKLNVEFREKEDTLIVEIKGDEGIMIGGAGALLGLPPRPTKISILAITSNIFMDIKNLTLTSLNIRLKASSLTIVDAKEPLFPCDSIYISSSISTFSFIGAGKRPVRYVNFHFNSSIVKFYFSGSNWENSFIYSNLSSISFSGSVPRVTTRGILNIKKGFLPIRKHELTINFKGAFNILKFMENFE